MARIAVRDSPQKDKLLLGRLHHPFEGGDLICRIIRFTQHHGRHGQDHRSAIRANCYWDLRAQATVRVILALATRDEEC